MLKGIRLATLVFYLFVFSNVVAQEKNIEVRNLKDEWLLFNARDDFYYPFAGNDLNGVSTISFPLELARWANYKLYLEVPGGSSVFINQKIAAYRGEPGALLFSIDSIREVHGRDDLFVTIYNPDLKNENNLHTSIIQTARIQNSDQDDRNEAGAVRRSDSAFDDFFGVAVIALLAMYATLLNMDKKRMRGYYNIARMFSMNIREEITFKGKVFDGSNIPFIVAHSFLVSFVGLFILFNRVEGFYLHRFGVALLTWTVGAGLVFILLALKYWLLSLIGELFKLPFVVRHYHEYFRMSTVFFTALFFIVLTQFLSLKSDLDNISQIVVNFVIIFLIIRVVALYFKFIRVTGFKNLYLFSYLCSTEILPMVVGLKILNN